MDLPLAEQILIGLLAAFAAAGLLSAFMRGPDDRAAARLAAVAMGRRGGVAAGGAQEAHRRRTVAETLRELEAKERAADKRGRASFAVRMRQAGLNWTKRTYILVVIVAGAGSFALSHFGFGLGEITSLGFGVAGGMLLPHAWVARARKRRFTRFSDELPNAIDIIVRGVRSGLPLIDCMKVISAEVEEPVRSEFKAIIDDHTLGMPIEEAVERLPERMPLPEAMFFAIVIAIQSRTGGSLSEALGNLAGVVRERRRMKAKIQTYSQEAKASAWIIASLPFLVTIAVYAVSPDYILLLFTTLPGNIILGVSGLWMLTGVLVMRKMINFDF